MGSTLLRARRDAALLALDGLRALLNIHKERVLCLVQ
jgi:hypothetical protein